MNAQDEFKRLIAEGLDRTRNQSRPRSPTRYYPAVMVQTTEGPMSYQRAYEAGYRPVIVDGKKIWRK